ncbi:excisionase family DNA binding protein [Flavobacteriaceae bacterium MAR_2009_75]|nr:excisionase family DNA binding protein [Flavobacteriaceae bacterium MAR_2009_75]
MDNVIFSTEKIDKLVETIAEAVSLKLKAESKNKSSTDEDELLTRDEASKLLKIDQSTLYHWTKSGRISAYAIGARRYYKKNELLQSLKPM